MLSLLLSLFALSARADGFSEGNDHYAAGEYAEAVEAYEAVSASGYESARLYYNLGNAYYRTGRLGPAILNYERALRLDPNDPDIRHNLEFAQLQTVDRINAVPEMFLTKAWRACRNVASSDTWAYCGVGLFIFALAAMAVYIFTKPLWLRKTGFSLSVIALVFTALTLTFSYQQKSEAESAEYAIVFAPTATVKSTPDGSGTDLFILHEGTKVKVGSHIGGWVEITMSDGNAGWLPASALEVI